MSVSSTLTFDLYLARRREDGHDVDDWLQAERELQGDKRPVLSERPGIG